MGDSSCSEGDEGVKSKQAHLGIGLTSVELTKGNQVMGEAKEGFGKACLEPNKAVTTQKSSRWKPKSKSDFIGAKIKEWEDDFRKKNPKKFVLRYSRDEELEN